MDIIKMSKVLIDKAGVKHVVVCFCLNRTRNIKNQAPATLEANLGHFNSSLAALCKYEISVLNLNTKGSGEISIKNHSRLLGQEMDLTLTVLKPQKIWKILEKCHSKCPYTTYTTTSST